MKVRFAFALAGLIALGTSAVIAQSDPIAARKALMKGNNDGASALVAMMRGTAPYDAAKVDPVYDQWAKTAKELPGLFPENSKTGDTRATPKVWQTKADFDAKSAEFGKAVADTRAQAKSNLDGLKAAVATVGKTCDNCHADYRARRN